MLTSPTATATFPLLAPDTTTGVYRSVVVLSPTCVKNIIISPTRTFPVTHNSPPENKQQESPGHKRLLPSRILHLQSKVHTSEAAHIALKSHYPNPSEITQVVAHDRNIAKWNKQINQIDICKSYKSTYITQSKRCLRAAQARNCHRCISYNSAAVANLQCKLVNQWNPL